MHSAFIGLFFHHPAGCMLAAACRTLVLVVGGMPHRALHCAQTLCLPGFTFISELAGHACYMHRQRWRDAHPDQTLQTQALWYSALSP